MGNKNQIGIFNVHNEVFFPTAKLKTQGSKNFFYGYDGKVEDGLSKIEGILSEIIKNIIEKKEVPKKFSDNHLTLLYFVALTDLRNPIRIEGIKKMLEMGKEKLLKEFPQSNLDSFYPNPENEQIIYLMLSMVSEIVNTIKDLDFKLIVNNTAKPFITSDFPIVRYNQLLEKKKWEFSKSGYGTIGLQIFIPINRNLMLLLFDAGIYKMVLLEIVWKEF